MPTQEENFQRLLEGAVTYWQQERLPVNPGASATTIRQLEQALAFSLPADFTTYLRHTNGFQGFASDTAWISFWSADRMTQELHERHPAELVCFADYCINLCSFGYHRTQPGIYIHYQTLAGTALVAETFSDFLATYLNDPPSLLRDL